MLTSLGSAALFGILGTFAAALWTVPIKLGGLPGSTLATVGTRRESRGLVTAGVVITFLVEAYLLLTFAGLIVRAIQGFLDPRPGIPAWPLWVAGCYLAVAPVLFGGRHAPGAAARDATDKAFTYALPLAALGYLIFVLRPEVLEWGWGWLPRFRL